MQISVLCHHQMIQLHILFFYFPPLVHLFVLRCYLQFMQLQLVLRSLQKILDSSLILSLQLSDVLNSPMMLNQQLKQILNKNLQNIQIILFNHFEQIFLCHLTSFLIQPIQSHFHGMPNPIKILHPQLDKPHPTHRLTLLQRSSYSNLIQMLPQIRYILQTISNHKYIAIKTEWNNPGLNISCTDL